MAPENNSGVKLSSLFAPEDILCGVGAIGRDECVRRLLRHLEKRKAIPDAKRAFEAVMAREALGSTVLVPGLVVPHARLPEIEGQVIAMATSRPGISLEEGGAEKANVLLLILTGTAEAGGYLQVLAGVAHAFSEKERVEQVARLQTPENVWEFFDKGAAVLPEFVTAADMMRTQVVTLHHTDTLAMAIDAFCRHDLTEIPVLDHDDDLVGIVAEEEILKRCLPEYILWLADLRPILQFEPFNEVLKDEHVIRLAEIMSNRYVTVEETTPAVQVARELMRQGARKVLVTRGKKLIGIITLSHFLARVFRG